MRFAVFFREFTWLISKNVSSSVYKMLVNIHTVHGQWSLGLLGTHVIFCVTNVESFVLCYHVNDPQWFVVQYLGSTVRHFITFAFPVDVWFWITAHLAFEFSSLPGVHSYIFGFGVYERFHCEHIQKVVLHTDYIG